MKTKLNEKTFRAVKLMTAGGANIAEIAECFAISSSTVSRIRTSESYEDYCSLRAAEYDQRKQERAEKARAPHRRRGPLLCPSCNSLCNRRHTEHPRRSSRRHTPRLSLPSSRSPR